MLYITLKSYNVNLLNQFCQKELLKVFPEVKGPISLPLEKKLYTVIRSSHVYSLSREQFEVCTHRRGFVLKKNYNFLKSQEKLRKISKFRKKLLKKIPVGISLKLSIK